MESSFVIEETQVWMYHRVNIIESQLHTEIIFDASVETIILQYRHISESSNEQFRIISCIRSYYSTILLLGRSECHFVSFFLFCAAEVCS